MQSPAPNGLATPQASSNLNQNDLKDDKHNSAAQQEHRGGEGCFFADRALFIFAKKNPLRKGCYYLVKRSPVYSAVILIAIILNSLLLAVRQPRFTLPDVVLDYVSYAELTFLGIFTLDILLRILAQGFILHRSACFREGWNIFRAIIVSLSFISTLKLLGDDTGGVNLSAFLVLLPVQALSQAKSLRALTNTVIVSAPMIGSTMLFLTMFVAFFALVGVELWGEKEVDSRCAMTIRVPNPQYLREHHCNTTDERNCDEGIEFLQSAGFSTGGETAPTISTAQYSELVEALLQEAQREQTTPSLKTSTQSDPAAAANTTEEDEPASNSTSSSSSSRALRVNVQDLLATYVLTEQELGSGGDAATSSSTTNHIDVALLQQLWSPLVAMLNATASLACAGDQSSADAMSQQTPRCLDIIIESPFDRDYCGGVHECATPYTCTKLENLMPYLGGSSREEEWPPTATRFILRKHVPVASRTLSSHLERKKENDEPSDNNATASSQNETSTTAPISSGSSADENYLLPFEERRPVSVESTTASDEPLTLYLPPWLASKNTTIAATWAKIFWFKFAERLGTSSRTSSDDEASSSSSASTSPEQIDTTGSTASSALLTSSRLQGSASARNTYSRFSNFMSASLQAFSVIGRDNWIHDFHNSVQGNGYVSYPYFLLLSLLGRYFLLNTFLCVLLCEYAAATDAVEEAEQKELEEELAKEQEAAIFGANEGDGVKRLQVGISVQEESKDPVLDKKSKFGNDPEDIFYAELNDASVPDSCGRSARRGVYTFLDRIIKPFNYFLSFCNVLILLVYHYNIDEDMWGYMRIGALATTALVPLEFLIRLLCMGPILTFTSVYNWVDIGIIANLVYEILYDVTTGVSVLRGFRLFEGLYRYHRHSQLDKIRERMADEKREEKRKQEMKQRKKKKKAKVGLTAFTADAFNVRHEQKDKALNERPLDQGNYAVQIAMLFYALVPAMLSVMKVLGILLVFVYMYAIIGMRLFGELVLRDANGDELRMNFYTLWGSGYTLFVVLMGEWTEVFYSAAEQTNLFITSLYFLSYVLLNMFVILNMIASVVYNKFEDVVSKDWAAELFFLNEANEAAEKHPPRLIMPPITYKHVIERGGKAAGKKVGLTSGEILRRKSQSGSAAPPPPPKKKKQDSENNPEGGGAVSPAAGDLEAPEEEQTTSVNLSGVRVMWPKLRFKNLAREHDKRPGVILQGKSLKIFGPDNGFRIFLSRLMFSWGFGAFTHLVTFFNLFLLTLQSTPRTLDFITSITPLDHDTILTIFRYSGYCFATIFFTEVAIKVIVLGLWTPAGEGLRKDGQIPFGRHERRDMVYPAFARSGLNVLAVLIACSAVASIWFPVFKFGRSLRSISFVVRFNGVRVAASSLAKSLPYIMRIVIMGLLVWVLTACIGVHIFAGKFSHCNDPVIAFEKECIGTFVRRELVQDVAENAMSSLLPPETDSGDENESSDNNKTASVSRISAVDLFAQSASATTIPEVVNYTNSTWTSHLVALMRVANATNNADAAANISFAEALGVNWTHSAMYMTSAPVLLLQDAFHAVYWSERQSQFVAAGGRLVSASKGASAPQVGNDEADATASASALPQASATTTAPPACTTNCSNSTIKDGATDEQATLSKYEELTKNFMQNATSPASPQLTALSLSGALGHQRLYQIVEVERKWERVVPTLGFDNLGDAFLSVFIVSTGENIKELLYMCIDATHPGRAIERDANMIGGTYAIITIVIGSFFIINSFIGVPYTYFMKFRKLHDGSLFLSDQQTMYVLSQQVIESTLFLIDNSEKPTSKFRLMFFNFMNYVPRWLQNRRRKPKKKRAAQQQNSDDPLASPTSENLSPKNGQGPKEFGSPGGGGGGYGMPPALGGADANKQNEQQQKEASKKDPNSGQYLIVERLTLLDFFIYTTIVLNFFGQFLSAIRLDSLVGGSSGESIRIAINWVNVISTFVFVFEAIVRIVALGIVRYFVQLWNRYDLFVAVFNLIEVIIQLGGLKEPMENSFGVSATFYIIKILNFASILKIVRLLKVLRRVHKIQKIFALFIYAFRGLMNVVVLFVVCVFIFGLLAVDLFGKIAPTGILSVNGNNFRDLPNAMLVLYQITSLSEWQQVMHACMVQEPECSEDEGTCGRVYIAVPFFVLFALFVGLFMVQLCISVVVDTFWVLERITAGRSKIFEIFDHLRMQWVVIAQQDEHRHTIREMNCVQLLKYIRRIPVDYIDTLNIVDLEDRIRLARTEEEMKEDEKEQFASLDDDAMLSSPPPKQIANDSLADGSALLSANGEDEEDEEVDELDVISVGGDDDPLKSPRTAAASAKEAAFSAPKFHHEHDDFDVVLTNVDVLRIVNELHLTVEKREPGFFSGSSTSKKPHPSEKYVEENNDTTVPIGIDGVSPAGSKKKKSSNSKDEDGEAPQCSFYVHFESLLFSMLRAWCRSTIPSLALTHLPIYAELTRHDDSYPSSYAGKVSGGVAYAGSNFKGALFTAAHVLAARFIWVNWQRYKRLLASGKLPTKEERAQRERERLERIKEDLMAREARLAEAAAAGKAPRSFAEAFALRKKEEREAAEKEAALEEAERNELLGIGDDIREAWVDDTNDLPPPPEIDQDDFTPQSKKKSRAKERRSRAWLNPNRQSPSFIQNEHGAIVPVDGADGEDPHADGSGGGAFYHPTSAISDQYNNPPTAGRSNYSSRVAEAESKALLDQKQRMKRKVLSGVDLRDL